MSFQERSADEDTLLSSMRLMHVTHRWRGHWFQLIDMLMPLVIYQLLYNFHVCLHIMTNPCWFNLTAREYFRSRRRIKTSCCVNLEERDTDLFPLSSIIYLHLPGHHLGLCHWGVISEQLDNWFDSTLKSDRWPMINLSVSVIYLRWLTFW